MKKQGNGYTLIYSIVLVLVVGILLSVVYQALKPMQDENVSNDKKRQILAATLIVAQDGESVADLYNRYITDSFIVNSKGDRIESDLTPFDIDVSAEVKKQPEDRELPVFVAITSDGEKYIIPVYGSGLWGPIWGYIAFDKNGRTIYGTYFAHQGETPGLGAEIETQDFQNQFKGKDVYHGNDFTSVAVVKVGQEPSDKAYVHAVSGGTITSQGVSNMIENSISPYDNFLQKLQNDK